MPFVLSMLSSRTVVSVVMCSFPLRRVSGSQMASIHAPDALGLYTLMG